jgi:DNA-binding SARP family transcriptional activator
VTLRAAEVWAFGPIAFAVDGHPEPVRGKPGTLLALLAFTGGAPVPLRLAAGGASVVTTPGGLALDLPADAVDVLRFQRMLQRKPLGQLDEDELRAALACWTAEPFPELLHVPEVQVAIDRLVRLRLDAIEALYDIELQRPASYPVVAELERMVRLHPERERLWQQLATALHRCSRRVEALRAIERCKRALVGVAPSPATLRLEHELLLDIA